MEESKHGQSLNTRKHTHAHAYTTHFNFSSPLSLLCLTNASVQLLVGVDSQEEEGERKGRRDNLLM